MMGFSKDPVEEGELVVQLGVDEAISDRHLGWWDLFARKCALDR